MSALSDRLLRACVPIRALTSQHLVSLMRDRSVERLYQGQKLFEPGDRDEMHLYLLQGKIRLLDAAGHESVVSDDEPLMWPVAHHQPRVHTAIAETDCSVLRFPSEMVDGMLAWDQAASFITLDLCAYEKDEGEEEHLEWMLSLLNSNLFYKVPPMRLQEVLGRFDSVSVKTGDVVVRQGEMGDACYFIEKGIAEVSRAEAPDNVSTRLATLQPGDAFGEDALLGSTVRNATVKMLTDGVLRKLQKQSFLELLKPDTAIAELSVEELKAEMLKGAVVVDVRTEDEYDNWHLDDAINMPLNLLKLKSQLLRRDDRIITCCESGRRSRAAAGLLAKDGYKASFCKALKTIT